MRPGWLTRSDGARLEVVPGFRERVLAMPRTAVRPTLDWGDAEFAAAASERIRRVERLLRHARKHGLTDGPASLLEIGCGPGIDAIIASRLAPDSEVIGIDLELPLLSNDTGAELVRRLADAVLAELGFDGGFDLALAQFPMRLARMSATDLELEDESFDFCWSDAVLEHVSPLDTCFAEMSRVLKPAGLAYHKVDPYFWLKGCHRRGLIDVPWAHARLPVDEVAEAARVLHGRAFATRCAARLNELNRLTPAAWRGLVDETGLTVLEWRTTRSEFAASVLDEYPTVPATLLPGVQPADLVDGTVQFWLSKP